MGINQNMQDAILAGTPWGFQPNISAVQFGSVAVASGFPGSMAEAGTLFRQVSAGIQPGTTGNDNVLAAYALPANALDIFGRGLYITAMGVLGSNANAKRIKILAGCTSAVVGQAVSGGTVIADTGALGATTAVGWSLAAQLYKYGLPGSNTQMALHQAAQWGSTVLSLIAPSALTLPENAPIIFAVTGNAGTAAADIILNLATVEGFN